MARLLKTLSAKHNDLSFMSAAHMVESPPLTLQQWFFNSLRWILLCPRSSSLSLF